MDHWCAAPGLFPSVPARSAVHAGGGAVITAPALVLDTSSIPYLPLTSCVTLDKSLHLSELVWKLVINSAYSHGC